MTGKTWLTNRVAASLSLFYESAELDDLAVKAAWMLSSKKSECDEVVNELTNLKNYSPVYHIIGYKPSDLACYQWAAEIIWIPIYRRS